MKRAEQIEWIESAIKTVDDATVTEAWNLFKTGAYEIVVERLTQTSPTVEGEEERALIEAQRVSEYGGHIAFYLGWKAALVYARRSK